MERYIANNKNDEILGVDFDQIRTKYNKLDYILTYILQNFQQYKEIKKW